MKTQQMEPLAHLMPELKDLMHDKQWDLLKELLCDISPLDLADSWYQFDNEERLKVFKLMESNSALILFESLPLDDQTELVRGLEESKVASVLESIPSKDVAEIFHQFPRKIVRKMVSLIRKEDAVKKIKLLMTFEPGTAGSLLHPEFIKLPPHLTCKNAMSLIQSISRVNTRKHLRSLYVTSDEGYLLGKVTLENIISAPPDSRLTDWMTSVEPIKIRPEMDQEKVAQIFSKYDLVSAPVVDENNKLMGSVVIDDIVDVISQEATEDIAKMAGTRPDELTEKSIFKIAWFRSPWLLATLGGQFLVFVVIRYFEFVLSEVIALASFLPLIAAMGGNVGAQTAMICVRSMALGQFKGKNSFFTVIRESLTGVLLGIGYGLLVGFIALILYGGVFGPAFAIVVGTSVCLAMSMAAITGVLGPLLLEKAGADPATAVGPIITTVTDLMGITIYFLLAVAILVRT